MYRIVLICLISILSEELAPIKAKITQPEEKYLFLNPGDELQIKCESYDELKQVSWAKQEFRQEEFQKIDTSGTSGYYTVASVKDGKLVSKFKKDRVTSADSGTYRCQGEHALADTVTVKVVEVTTRDGLVEKFAGNETQMECFGRDHLNTSYTTKWLKRGIPDVLHVGDLFHFRKPGLYDIGEYECLISDEKGRNMTRVVNLFSYPYVKIFEKSKNIIEGESLKLNCAAYGWPKPGVTWYRNGQLLDPVVDSRVSFPNGTSVFQSLIIVDKMELTDRAEYTCVATTDRYPGVTYNTTVLVRVKGRFAALWPFIGICFEVIVLCIIIVVYERRRSKRTDEDDAIVEVNNKDNVATNCNSTEESLRQRKQ